MWKIWIPTAAVLVLLITVLHLFHKTFGRKTVPSEAEAFANWERRFGIDTGPLQANMEWFRSQPLQTITVRSGDGLLLTADYLPAEGERRGRLVMMHGYHSGPWDFSGAIRWYYEAGFDLLVPDQRAHGRSQGKYCGFGVLESRDCRIWVEEANYRFGEEVPTLLTGISMGATTVLMAAGEPLPDNVKGVVADCGFTSPKEILLYEMDHLMHLPRWPLYPVICWLLRLLAGYRPGDYSTVRAMENNRLPVLFVHGEADTFVPPEMTMRAYRACRTEKQLVLVPGAGHGMSYLLDREGYQQALETLFACCGIPMESNKD